MAYTSNHNKDVVIKISNKFRKLRTYQTGYLIYCFHYCEVQTHIKLAILMQKLNTKQNFVKLSFLQKY